MIGAEFKQPGILFHAVSKMHLPTLATVCCLTASSSKAMKAGPNVSLTVQFILRFEWMVYSHPLSPAIMVALDVRIEVLNTRCQDDFPTS